jgi:hypothetical protein
MKASCLLPFQVVVLPLAAQGYGCMPAQLLVQVAHHLCHKPSPSDRFTNFSQHVAEFSLLNQGSVCWHLQFVVSMAAHIIAACPQSSQGRVVL